jgi:hypothetical integral membrane protein (TIGR02206 family)
MSNIFLENNGNFKNFGWEHGLAFTGCIIFIIFILRTAKTSWNGEQQRLYITIICGFGAFMQLFKLFYRYSEGIMNPATDLPLHLCNLMTLLIPIVMWYKWRTMWAITFFWIMAGCAQSIFTPTLTESLPHYEAIRYWAVHAVIILGALYGTYVFGWTLTWQDAVRSAIGINVLAMILYPINLALGANYMYLNAKPPGKTFYDLLGPWPDYIFMLEFVVAFAFALVLIPFYLPKLKIYLKTNILS